MTPLLQFCFICCIEFGPWSKRFPLEGEDQRHFCSSEYFNLFKPTGLKTYDLFPGPVRCCSLRHLKALVKIFRQSCHALTRQTQLFLVGSKHWQRSFLLLVVNSFPLLFIQFFANFAKTKEPAISKLLCSLP